MKKIKTLSLKELLKLQPTAAQAMVENLIDSCSDKYFMVRDRLYCAPECIAGDWSGDVLLAWTGTAWEEASWEDVGSAELP